MDCRRTLRYRDDCSEIGFEPSWRFFADYYRQIGFDRLFLFGNIFNRLVLLPWKNSCQPFLGIRIPLEFSKISSLCSPVLCSFYRSFSVVLVAGRRNTKPICGGLLVPVLHLSNSATFSLLSKYVILRNYLGTIHIFSLKNKD